MADLTNLYSQFYASARGVLRKWGCSNFIFEDLYHEAFFILLEKQKNAGTVIRYPHTYLIRICIYLWLKENKRLQIHEQYEENEAFDDRQAEPGDQKMHLLLKHWKSISPECQKILTFFSRNYTEDKISKTLHLKGAKAVNNRMHYCKAKLRSMIKKDPLYKEING